MLHKCRKFMEKTVSDRIKVVQNNRLCFGCPKSGHQSKSCQSRSVCDVCHKQHPTCLHAQQSKEWSQSQEQPSTTQEKHRRISQYVQHKEATTPATSNRVVLEEADKQTAAIIPVWLSSSYQPVQEVLVYALLDSQSDTFVLGEIAESLEVKKEPVKLRISTMTSRTTLVDSQKIDDLQVRGFYTDKICSPPVYTRDFIPANRSHIPADETTKAWSHLKHLQGETAPLQDCEVGLLIGYNCSHRLCFQASCTAHGPWMECCWPQQSLPRLRWWH